MMISILPSNFQYFTKLTDEDIEKVFNNKTLNY